MRIRIPRIVLSFLVFLSCASVICGASGSAPVGATSIGKVDLVTVLGFHPRMALYDPAFRAFVRLEVADLFKPDLEQRLAELTRLASETGVVGGNPSTPSSGSSLSEELQVIEDQRRDLLRRIDSESDPKRQAEAELELARVAARMVELERASADADFRKRHPQFTSPEETEEVFRTIEKEVLAVVDEVAREKGVTVVLNQSTLEPASMPSLVEVAPVPPVQASRLGTSLYYGFLNASDPAGELLENTTAANRHPRMLSGLHLRPHPLVLAGGLDLTTEVLGRVLLRNAVPDERRRMIVEYLGELLVELR